jgi:alpha-L-fucosidase
MLLRNLIDIASKGGNYLLNVGPDSLGVIPDPEVQRLKEMGDWLKANGESIYATSASPYRKLPFNGRATVKGNQLYVNVFSWPESGIELPGLQNKIRSVRTVAGKTELKFQKQSNGTVVISKPSKVDPISTAIVLTLDGAPSVVEPEILIVRNSAGGFSLGAADCEIEGNELKVEGEGKPNLGFWMRREDRPVWRLQNPMAGRFDVSMSYSCETGTAGSEFELYVNGKPSGVKGVVTGTKGWSDYKTVAVEGDLDLPSGKVTVELRIRKKPGFAVMNLRGLMLKAK